MHNWKNVLFLQTCRNFLAGSAQKLFHARSFTFAATTPSTLYSDSLFTCICEYVIIAGAQLYVALNWLVNESGDVPLLEHLSRFVSNELLHSLQQHADAFEIIDKELHWSLPCAQLVLFACAVYAAAYTHSDGCCVGSSAQSFLPVCSFSALWLFRNEMYTPHLAALLSLLARS